MSDHADTIRRAINANAMMNDWPLIRSAGLAAVDKQEAERKQAIDALREIADMPEPIRGGNTPAGSQCDFLKGIARAALVSLGETE